MNQGNNKQILAGIAVIVIIALVVVGVMALAPKKAQMASSGTSTDAPSDSAGTSAAPASNASYKDGSYTATASYDSPGGTQKITIAVTLKNGVITDTSATSGAIDDEGTEFQGDFISGYKSLVVGKNINSVTLSRVSGSSLTSQGFNTAITTIKGQAQD